MLFFILFIVIVFVKSGIAYFEFERYVPGVDFPNGCVIIVQSWRQLFRTTVA